MKTKMILLVMSLITILSVPVSAKTNASEKSTDYKYVKTDNPQELMGRLHEIQGITKDAPSLTIEQKRELRAETKEIKSKLKEVGGGVYLSAGAVILIALVLIILL